MKRSELTEIPVSKNDVVEIDIDDLGYEGEGIAHIEGFTLFVKYALPGERVRALVIFVKPTFAVAKLQSVLRPSPDRCEPACPVYGKCGGCTLRHMNYTAQLSFKRKSVAETFRKAGISVLPDEVVPSPQTAAYRNKMSLPVRSTPPKIGFFAESSHRIVEIDECPIQFSGNGEIITAFRKFMCEHNLSGYDETALKGVVRHISVRKLGGFVIFTVVVNGTSAKPVEKFDEVLRTLYGGNYAFYVNFNTSAGNRILGEKSVLAGGADLPVEADGLSLHVHPQSFFQVNDGVRESLYREAAAQCAQSDTVIDAYSGAGVLSAILARGAKSVTAVEIEPKAVESARSLLSLNGISNVELVCGDCAVVLPDILANLPESESLCLVLDPPRAGCGRTVSDAALAAAPDKIVYISCNPATLSRDAAILIQGGYKISRLTPFDMFPHTSSVETLCVFTRNERKL